jgi:RNA polymerase sigma-70 factor (ECF subfamily)
MTWLKYRGQDFFSLDGINKRAMRLINESPMDEDIRYIERFLAGEHAGFEALVKKYQSRVLNIVYSMIGRDRDCDDIMQDVFLKVYHHLRGFNRASRFSTWLYRIVANSVYDLLRRRKTLVLDNDALETRASKDDDPQEALLAKEREAMVQEALNRVPSAYRMAIVLKDIEGLSYEEISHVLRCRIGTVESKIFRGRQYLREAILKGEGGVA